MALAFLFQVRLTFNYSNVRFNAASGCVFIERGLRNDVKHELKLGNNFRDSVFQLYGF